MGSWVSIYEMDDMFSSIKVGTNVRQQEHSCTRIGNQDRDQNITDHVTDHPNSHVHVWHLFVDLDINSHASDTQRDSGNTNAAPDHRVIDASHTSAPRAVPAAGSLRPSQDRDVVDRILRKVVNSRLKKPIYCGPLYCVYITVIRTVYIYDTVSITIVTACLYT